MWIWASGVKMFHRAARRVFQRAGDVVSAPSAGAHWVYRVLLWRLRALLYGMHTGAPERKGPRTGFHRLEQFERVVCARDDKGRLLLKWWQWKPFPFCQSYWRFVGCFKLDLARLVSEGDKTPGGLCKTQLSSPHLQKWAIGMQRCFHIVSQSPFPNGPQERCNTRANLTKERFNQIGQS